jgi:hypothetical protein
MAGCPLSTTIVKTFNEHREHEIGCHSTLVSRVESRVLNLQGAGILREDAENDREALCG